MTDLDGSRGTESLELIGRTAELDLMETFVGRAFGHGDALLLTGEAGVGKTVLLDAACRIAATEGAHVVRSVCVQFEAEVGFAGLNQLFLSLRDRLDRLSELHREALSAALGMGTGRTVGPLVVSTAALALLRDVAQREPVLVVVDDAQWLDRSSARVLGFIARRLEGSRIGLLIAVRIPADSLLLHAGLPQFELSPLDERATTELLSSEFPGLATSVRHHVMAAAQGNPLALRELPASMTDEQRHAVVPLPPVLPLSDRLQRHFAYRLHALPAVTRRMLLVTALDGTGDLRALRHGSSGDNWLDGLAPAERDRLIQVEASTNRFRFRHPLIGAAAVGLATSAERRRAHAVLADLCTDDPERRAWHIAEAVVGPDEPAAALLEVAAERSLHKGDAVRAVHALLRAADLSPRGADRARRLATAASVGADAAGYLRSVPEWLAAARKADPDTEGSPEVTVAAAHHLLNREGDVDTVHSMLVRALESALLRGLTGRAVEEALHLLMLVCHVSGRDEPWRPFTSALARLGDDAPPVLSLSARLYEEPVHASAADLDRLEGLVATLRDEVDPTRTVRVALAAFYVDRLAGCRSSLWQVVESGRDGGAAASAINALVMLAHEAYREGRWDTAAGAAAEGIAWSERLGYRLIALPGVACHALLSAARGDDQATRSSVDELVAWATPRGVRMLDHFAAWARALAALGRRDYEDAYWLLTAISPPGRLEPHVPVALWVAKDLVEAAVRTGRSEEARAHVAAMQRTEIFRLSPRLTLLCAGAAALVASGDDARDGHFEALAVPGAERFPFEHARVRLAYGEHLRRARSTSAARVQLAAALETFERLGARPWADHALHELRATGQTHQSPVEQNGDPAALTPQEHEIASLAASGLSNKQIGSRLYLSPRTVSGHLYRIFPKLGITTRAALRDALSQAVPPPVTRTTGLRARDGSNGA
ncbi:ATP-binding protein [Geodermatophilus sabuli]|uniref:Regulatory protein, luxR family n=1 Tax=Geodermatophilus sabuli TaxID=1564158 RepID=A0A285EI40_9ACTN|nr:LuxR family transcriptional regulator [Geodermatophilus sabuli]MBB3086844.1 DNA-binding CsgD family transcriptional regulator [Geodermatophilus sabuli]SNX98782.1 regulatory protein, luxR family [Geodermatophilus sabuli]